MRETNIFNKLLLIILFTTLGCVQIDKKENMMTLEFKISKTNYGDLFLRSDYSFIDSIWNEGKNEEKLKKILEDEKSSLTVKFLTAEILRYFEVDITKKFSKQVSSSYLYSLIDTSEEGKNIAELNGNLWGFLYDQDDTGHLGEVFIKLGDDSVNDLEKGLTNNAFVFYEGSREATTGNSYQYRVKDFAAFYISKIKDIPMTFYQDFEKRDAEIERLKEILENE